MFGHSYGGFVALETARRSPVFRRIALYEPGVSISGSIPHDWMPAYRARLAQGDTRGAFATMVKQAGFPPRPLARMPLWYVRLVLRLAIRQREWRRMEPLLGANLAEHAQQALLDDGTVNRYATITADVLVSGGTKSPAFIITEPLQALQRTIPTATLTMIDRLDHLAPEKHPAALAQHVRPFFEQRN